MTKETSNPVEPGASLICAAPTRRLVLKAGAVALGFGSGGVGLGSFAALAQDAADSSPAATLTTCVLTPELTEGPYYLPVELIRQDITEDKPGVPLRLRIAVQDITACAPLADAAVDVWHCDAQGYYSGVTGEPGGGASEDAGEGAATGTFLRGIQLTDAEGMTEFLTIYPGWYTGRTVHIHMKVHSGGTVTADDAASPAATLDEAVADSHVSHTGQLFFDEAISAEVYATAEAYAGRDDTQRTLNADDNILGDHADEPGFIVALEGSVEEGCVGTIVIGVDPASTPTGVNGGGDPGAGGPGEGGPGGPPDGTPPPR